MMYILVVEDSEELRATLAELLSASGFSSVLVNDGAAAMQHLASGSRPAMILLDLLMPRMDGEAFRQAQLAHPAHRNIPVVVMSASRSIDAEALGVKWILRKPFTIDQVLSAVTAALR